MEEKLNRRFVYPLIATLAFAILGGAGSFKGAIAQPAQVESDRQAEELFNQGLEDYRAGRYQNACRGFSDLLNRFPKYRRSSAAQLMLGKTHYKLGNYEQAIKAAEKLFHRFPKSSYRDDACYLMGHCYYRLGKYGQAVEQYLTVIDTGGDPRLKWKSKRLIVSLLERRLSPDEIRGFIEEHSDNPYLVGMMELAEEVERKRQAIKKIGVICPLTGDFAGIGQEALNGIRLALDRSRLENFKMVLADSRGDPIQSIKATQRLIERDNVVAILGPVRSAPTIGAAAIANSRHVPLITPTATRTGIASIGEYIFQTNVTTKMQGRRVAEFAMNELNLSTFATLSPFDPYGRGLTEGFVTRVEELGGTILTEEWYYEGTTDFTNQFERIRKAGLRLEQADSVAWQNKLSELTAAEVDTSELLIPVESIDGMFIPAYGEDIPLIAPQVAFHKIETQILGGNEWNSEEVIRSGGEYVEGAIFAADFVEQNSSSRFNRFVTDYRRKHGTVPGKAAALGYDAMALLTEAIRNGATSREEIKLTLAKTRGFEGVSGRISFFEGNRVNGEVFMLSIVNGKLVELGW